MHFSLQLATDRFVKVDAQLSAYFQSNVTNSSVYYYTFGYDGANTFRNFFTPLQPGMEDLLCCFQT